MTTIVAVRGPALAVLGCDTLATDNTGRAWPVRSKLLVLGEEDDRTVIGLTGPRMIRHALDALGPPAWATCDSEHRAIRVWVEQLAAMLRDRSVPTCEDGLIDAAQLVAHGDRLWYCTDGLAEPVETAFTAIGSGGDVALGYLTAVYEQLAEHDEALDTVTARIAASDAIRAASRHDTGTGGDVHVVELADGRTSADLIEHT